MSQLTEAGDATDARGRLVEAALELFAVKGFRATTTRDIASVAGMSPAALYVHYKSKEDLLYLISRTGHERTLALVRDAAAGSTDDVERLLAVVRSFTAHHARGHISARVVNYELASLSPEHVNEIAGIRHSIEQEIKQIVASGVDSGAFHTSNPRMTAVALLSLGVDVARWYRDEGEWNPEEIADYYCEVALRIVAAQR